MSDLPATMTAIEVSEPGGPEALKPVSQPLPSVGAGEILIKVAAAGINRADILQRRGFYPPPPGAPNTPGLEAAGTVAALGAGVSGFAIGDEVCCLLAGGGYAEYCAVPAPQVLPVPKGLSMVEAGAVPETFFTVWTNVFDQAGLKSGERFLVHGGSSGIGTTAIQLAHAFGAETYATAGSAEKCAACEKLGAKRAINYREEDFVAVIKDATNGEGVDVILDMVGGEYVQRNFAALAVGGRLVNIAFMGGAKAQVDFNPFLRKRLTFSGSTLRARPVEEKGEIAASLRQKAWPLLEDGTVKAVIDSTYPLADAPKAHERMESSAHIGKIVLTMG
ncbi:MAG: NAD(P)H-quinone oxidoreductase [Proteobacteria bacterium]|nr:NAD(P)H-quinone oxidoreductase [Pseudomonadota bacterium]